MAAMSSDTLPRADASAHCHELWYMSICMCLCVCTCLCMCLCMCAWASASACACACAVSVHVCMCMIHSETLQCRKISFRAKLQYVSKIEWHSSKRFLSILREELETTLSGKVLRNTRNELAIPNHWTMHLMRPRPPLWPFWHCSGQWLCYSDSLSESGHSSFRGARDGRVPHQSALSVD